MHQARILQCFIYCLLLVEFINLLTQLPQWVEGGKFDAHLYEPKDINAFDHVPVVIEPIGMADSAGCSISPSVVFVFVLFCLICLCFA
jgi:hypothetical protein